MSFLEGYSRFSGARVDLALVPESRPRPILVFLGNVFIQLFPKRADSMLSYNMYLSQSSFYVLASINYSSLNSKPELLRDFSLKSLGCLQTWFH